MKSVNRELLWNRIDKLKVFDKQMVEVYTAVKRIVELEVQGQRSYINSMKQQLDLISRLNTDLASRNHFWMMRDSFDLFTRIIQKRMEKQKAEMDSVINKVFNPFSQILNQNEEIVQILNQSEKNLVSIMDLGNALDDKYAKLSKASNAYDVQYEEEQIRHQLKNLSTKMSKSSNPKLMKCLEKIKEEDKNYRFQLDNYDMSMPALLNTNVDLRYGREILWTNR